MHVIVKIVLNLQNLSSLIIKEISKYDSHDCVFVIKGIFEFYSEYGCDLIDDWYRLILAIMNNNKNMERYLLVLLDSPKIFDYFLNFLKSNGESGKIIRIKEIAFHIEYFKFNRQIDLLELDSLGVYREKDLKYFNLLKSVKH